MGKDKMNLTTKFVNGLATNQLEWLDKSIVNPSHSCGHDIAQNIMDCLAAFENAKNSLVSPIRDSKNALKGQKAQKDQKDQKKQKDQNEGKDKRHEKNQEEIQKQMARKLLVTINKVLEKHALFTSQQNNKLVELSQKGFFRMLPTLFFNLKQLASSTNDPLLETTIKKQAFVQLVICLKAVQDATLGRLPFNLVYEAQLMADAASKTGVMAWGLAGHLISTIQAGNRPTSFSSFEPEKFSYNLFCEPEDSCSSSWSEKKSFEEKSILVELMEGWRKRCIQSSRNAKRDGEEKTLKLIAGDNRQEQMRRDWVSEVQRACDAFNTLESGADAAKFHRVTAIIDTVRALLNTCSDFLVATFNPPKEFVESEYPYDDEGLMHVLSSCMERVPPAIRLAMLCQLFRCVPIKWWNAFLAVHNAYSFHYGSSGESSWARFVCKLFCNFPAHFSFLDNRSNIFHSHATCSSFLPTETPMDVEPTAVAKKGKEIKENLKKRTPTQTTQTMIFFKKKQMEKKPKKNRGKKDYKLRNNEEGDEEVDDKVYWSLPLLLHVLWHRIRRRV